MPLEIGSDDGPVDPRQDLANKKTALCIADTGYRCRHQATAAMSV